MAEMTIRIVDDDPDLLASQKFFLQMAGYEVATYTSGLEFLQSDDFRKPGCLILDVRMPQMTGMQLHQILIDRGCDLPVIFLSAHGDIHMAVHAVKHGAVDFLEKPADPQELIQTVEKALDTVREKQKALKYQSDRQRLFDTLTVREKQVIELVACAKSNKEIAEMLDIGLPTVKMHRAHATAKLNLKTAVEIAEFMRSLG